MTDLAQGVSRVVDAEKREKLLGVRFVACHALNLAPVEFQSSGLDLSDRSEVRGSGWVVDKSDGVMFTEIGIEPDRDGFDRSGTGNRQTNNDSTNNRSQESHDHSPHQANKGCIESSSII